MFNNFLCKIGLHAWLAEDYESGEYIHCNKCGAGKLIP